MERLVSGAQKLTKLTTAVQRLHQRKLTSDTADASQVHLQVSTTVVVTLTSVEVVQVFNSSRLIHTLDERL